MALTLNSVTLTWDTDTHGSQTTCCRFSVEINYTDSKTLNTDGTHIFTRGESTSFNSWGTIAVNSDIETLVHNRWLTLLESTFSLTASQVAALTTRTVSSAYPTGS